MVPIYTVPFIRDLSVVALFSEKVIWHNAQLHFGLDEILELMQLKENENSFEGQSSQCWTSIQVQKRGPWWGGVGI